MFVYNYYWVEDDKFVWDYYVEYKLDWIFFGNVFVYLDEIY